MLLLDARSDFLAPTGLPSKRLKRQAAHQDITAADGAGQLLADQQAGAGAGQGKRVPPRPRDSCVRPTRDDQLAVPEQADRAVAALEGRRLAGAEQQLDALGVRQAAPCLSSVLSVTA